MDATTLAAIKRARFEDFVAIRQDGEDYLFTPADMAKAKTVLDVDDLSDSLQPDNGYHISVTKAIEIVRQQKPVVLINGLEFRLAEVKKAKAVRALRVMIDKERMRRGTLTRDGKLEVGCQIRSLANWAGPGGDEVIEEYHTFTADHVKAERDIIIPILQAKLARELAAHPPTRKRARAAA